LPKLIPDANMLALFVIGSVGSKLLGVAKRVKKYRPSDHDLIYVYLSLFSEVVLLPNIIGEASNLLDHLKGGRREHCMECLAQLVQGSSERCVASVSTVEQPEHMALGVADAAVLCALEGDTYLLTADRELYLGALYRGREARCFQDLREQAA